MSRNGSEFLSLEWPVNLYRDILVNEWKEYPPKDLEDGVNFVLSSLTAKERDLLLSRYKYYNKLQTISENSLGTTTRENARGNIGRILRKIRNSRYKYYIQYGVEGRRIRVNAHLAKILINKKNNDAAGLRETYENISIQELNLSSMLVEKLRRLGFNNLQDLRNSSYRDLLKISSIGVLFANNIYTECLTFGINLKREEILPITLPAVCKEWPFNLGEKILSEQELNECSEDAIEVEDRVLCKLDSLASKHKQLLLMRFKEGRTYRDISEFKRIDMTISCVYYQIAASIKHLKKVK